MDTASDSGKGVFGLYGSVADACAHHKAASWKDVVVGTINGDRKPAVESDITEC